MADTCFLCAVGARHAIPAPAASSTEGFGTCNNCSVHACPRHGERQRQYFRCWDCISGEALSGALAPVPDVIDVDEGDPVDEFGLLTLIAESPGVALTGLDLFEADLVGPMQAGLARMGHSPRRAIEVARARLTADLAVAEIEAVESALGLPPELVDRLREGSAIGLSTGHTVVDVARAKLRLVFRAMAEQCETIEPTREPSVNRAEYALGVLAGAFAAREAPALTGGVFTVASGLQMPPLVILLSTLLVTELEHGPGTKSREMSM
jgi:hypothetical protein